MISFLKLVTSEDFVQKTSKLKKLAFRLLSTTCLTVAGSVAAMAGTVTLTQGAQETFAGRDILPAGTTQVNGVVSLTQGSAGDFFEFVGLPGNASFSSINLTIQLLSGLAISADYFTDAGVSIGSTSNIIGTVQPSGTVPSNGNLVVEILPSNEGASSYSVTIATSAPEPATLSAIGLGLAGIGVLGLRRRNRK